MEKVFLTILLALLSVVSLAQSVAPKELYFDHLFVKDGLPEGTVTSLLQDREGYMWIGTQKGLVRFDGYTIKAYRLGIQNPFVLIISKMYQDRLGRLWVGTMNSGLFLYSRENDSFISYIIDPTPNPALSDLESMVTDIHDDRDGNIWITSTRWVSPETNTRYFDLCLLNTQTKKVTYYGPDRKGKYYTPPVHFFSLFEDKEGHIWVSSDNGLFEFDYKDGTFIHHLPSLNEKLQMAVYNIYPAPSDPDKLWMTNTSHPSIYDHAFTVRKGLWQFNMANDSVRAFLHNPEDPGSVAGDTIFSLLSDAGNHLWIGTSNGLSLFNPSKNNFTNFRFNDGKSNLIRELEKDKDGNLWCATPDGLLFFNVRTHNFIRYAGGNGGEGTLVSGVVHNLLVDNNGTLWTGVTQTGLQWINEKRSLFTYYTNNHGRLNNFSGGTVSSFAQSKDSTLLILTNEGLYQWQPQTDLFKKMPIGNGFITGKVPLGGQNVMADSRGYLWIGSDNSGLYRYDPHTRQIKNFRFNKRDNTSLSNNVVSSLLEDHLGNIWVGTLGSGLCRFNRETQSFTRYPYNESSFGNFTNNGGTDNGEILNIYEDSKGTIWVGTNKNGGLDSLNRRTGTFTSFRKMNPGFATLAHIFEDHNQELWTGAIVEGLFRLNQKRDSVKRYGEEDGLLYDGVTGIVEDEKGNIWVSSLRGISVLNLQTGLIRTITSSDGLPSENLYGAFKTKAGEFLFGTDNGFIALNPADFEPGTLAPIVHIQSLGFLNPRNKNSQGSSVIIYGKKNIRLPYYDNRITFHYVGLDYQNAAEIRYAYKLDGYDKNWIQAGVQRTEIYTNLSPGTYTFHLKAANGDGVWSEEESFVVIITPPWWQTWWAYIVYAALLVACVWGFVNYRSRNLKRKNQLLEKKVTQRTSELKQSLEDLKSTQAQLIQSEKMASLGELTAGIAHEIQNPLNFVNNFSDINQELIGELVEEANKGNTEEVKEIANDIKSNSEKINHHGKRADAIVKGMLQHSRSSNGVKETTDINALCDEYLRLSYHGLRAKDKSFNAAMETKFDENVGKINVVPQDIGRVLLNIINNAFFAVNERGKSLQGFQNLEGLQQGYVPTVTLVTRKDEKSITISVRDNGSGIPEKIKDKIFQPFFTTKPTGSGTGLGLSLAYDIVKAHRGTLNVDSKEGVGTEFKISLPIS